MSKISTFAVRLQKLLEIKGISKAELSRITGINKSSLTHYVKGDWEGKQDAVYAIARATDVSEAWLMGYDVPMTQKESRKLEIAQKMKNLRIRAGLTQLQVAEKLGITYEAITNYEQGIDSIEPHLFNAMCSIYDVAPISILSPDEETEMYDALFEMMMSRLQPKKKKAPLYSSEAMRLAQDYDSLDSYGQRVVRLVADNEIARCAAVVSAALQEQQKEPIPVSEDGQDELEEFVRKHKANLTDGQQQKILEMMQAMIEPQKELQSPSAREKADEKAPKTECPGQS